MRKGVVLAATVVVAVLVAASPARAGDWRWPVVGPVLRAFEPPASPYGSGHRGIDIAASSGTSVVAPAPGRVSFAGPVAGELFASVDHGGGLVSTYSWLSGVVVQRGDRVAAGEVIAATGSGHVTLEAPHLHMGVRLDGTYVDPLDYLGAPSVSDIIRLAPIDHGT
jgi:murein DD-endopeptidase MepM/ murein hydrolase activator NlpD